MQPCHRCPFPTSWLLNRRVIQRSDASCMNYTDHTQFLTILNDLIINATSSTSSFWWFFSRTSLVSLRASCRPSCKAPAFSTTAAFPRRFSRRKAINFLIYPYIYITKGSVSYLSSPCFSTSLGGIGGPARGIHGILAVMYWISITRAPPENSHGFNSHGWRGHGPPH